MKNFYYYLIRPFTKYLSIFTTIFLLISISGAYIYTIIYPANLYAAYLILHGFLIAYAITLIISLIPFKNIRFLFSSIIILFLSLFFLPEFYCAQQLKAIFDADFATLLLATNTNEAFEFMQAMIPVSFIIWTCFIFFTLIFLFYLIKKHVHLNRKQAIIPLFIVIIAAIAFIHNPAVWKHSIEGKISSIMNYKVPDNLKDFYKQPSLQKINDSPHNIVVIMGESLTKHHCSIYGYDKLTNPLLSQYIADSTLIVFNDVTSAGLSTMGSFTYMMSGYCPESKNESKKWYEYTLLNDVLKQANYQTHWFSNHANVGIHNNVTRLLAYDCDDYHFCGNQLSGDFRTSYDEDVIELARPLINNYDKESNHFYFFHLMGSHFKFDLRYPKEFSIFSEKDYSKYPEHQRKTLASYDNSVLYNDSIVYEIMSLFKDKEAIILYLSDHGLDLYYSSDYHAAHGIPNNPISAKYGSEIPFLVFTPPKYKEHFPKTIERLKLSINNKFRTDNLMYFIMDIMGYKFSENNDMEQYSPLK